MMDALMISPVDGSTHDGPIALEIIAGTYLMQEYLRLSGSNSGSSSGVGKSLIWMTFFRPIFSNAVFHLRMPFLAGSLHSDGNASSI